MIDIISIITFKIIFWNFMFSTTNYFIKIFVNKKFFNIQFFIILFNIILFSNSLDKFFKNRKNIWLYFNRNNYF